MGKLPQLLRGYHAWIPEDWRIVVLLDADEGDCQMLKARLNRAARSAEFTVRARGVDQFQVLNRFAVEELEAWFFGDVEALRTIYPRVDPNLANQAKYRDPDAIRGGTWETLERLLQRLRHHETGLPKITVARDVSAHMDPARNRSHSFQVFREGLLALVS